MKSQVWILLFGLLLRGAEAAELGYPSEWWAPVPTNEAALWEVLPQAAGPGEVILSKRTELGILSNFAPTPFSLDGEKYASVEGFWQMLKYPEGPGDERLRDPTVVWPHARAEVAAMVGFEAKAAGAAANLTANPLEAMTTVTFQIVAMLTGEGSFDHPATLSAFALGFVLFLVTLGLNFVALRVVKRFREAYE